MSPAQLALVAGADPKDDAGGSRLVRRMFRILDLPTLIRAKKATGRAKDREAVLELEVLRELRRS